MRLLKLLLPQFLTEHFEFKSVKRLEKKEEEELHLYFKEKNILPKEFSSEELISKGFLDEIIIKNFPLRDKHVCLHIKRRRWASKRTKEITKRDWQLIAKKTPITREFDTFLEGIKQ